MAKTVKDLEQKQKAEYTAIAIDDAGELEVVQFIMGSHASGASVGDYLVKPHGTDTVTISSPTGLTDDYDEVTE